MQIQESIDFLRGIHPGIKIFAGLIIFWGLVALFYGRKPVD